MPTASGDGTAGGTTAGPSARRTTQLRPVRGGGPFIGRDHELAMIADACASASKGQSQLIVVGGEAGVGKTTLCERAAARAEHEGFVVGWGRCWPDGGAPPLWPWPAVLDELAGDAGRRLLAEDAGHGELDADRFARFAAVGHVLSERSESAPLMVVIDDVHVADAAVILLSRYLIRALARCRLLLLVTRRTDVASPPPVSGPPLAEFEREGTVVALRSFDLHETASYLTAHGLDVEDDGLISAIARITHGNPFLLARTAARASATNALAGIEHVVDDAVTALSSAHRRVVGMAAILGTETAAGDIAFLSGGELGQVFDALSSASSAGLIELHPWGCRFTHDLVRTVALQALTPLETLDAHARAVGLAPDDRRPPAVARRAHHALTAAARSDDDALRAVAECRHAAAVFARSFDYERAAALLRDASTFAERLTTPGDHVYVLLEWADALRACGRLADARCAYTRCADAAERAADPLASARAALGLGGVWVNEHRGDADRQRVLGLQRCALAGLPADAVDLRARLTVRLAAEAVYDGAPVEPVLDALAAARKLDDPRVLAEALSLTHHALLAPEHLERRFPLSDELIRVASAAGDDLHVLFGLLWKTVDLFHLGDACAVRSLVDLRCRAEAVGCRSVSYIVAALDVMRLIRDGRLDDAEAAATDCFHFGQEVGDADAAGYYGAHLLTIRWLQGRDVELLELAREMADSPTLVQPEFAFRAARAALAARAGHLDEAALTLKELTADGLDALPRSSTWLIGIVVIVDAARTLGDAVLAAEAYRLLSPLTNRPIMPSLAVSCLGSVEWAIGVALSTMGETESAVEHFESAVQSNRRLGHAPMAVIAEADRAQALAARGGRADREAAVQALQRAAGAADEIGLPKRAEAWRTRCATLSEDSSGPDDGVLRRDGNRWVLTAGTHCAVVPDLVGVRYLADLLTRPGAQISAIDLCGGSTVERSAQGLIDREALDAYRRRVEELDAALATAQVAADRHRLSRLSDEREALRAELASVLAISGQPRRFVDPSERARTAVRKAITRAINAIEASNRDLGSELRTTISTGQICCYVPDPARPRRWSVIRRPEPSAG